MVRLPRAVQQVLEGDSRSTQISDLPEKHRNTIIYECQDFKTFKETYISINKHIIEAVVLLWTEQTDCSF